MTMPLEDVISSTVGIVKLVIIALKELYKRNYYDFYVMPILCKPTCYWLTKPLKRTKEYILYVSSIVNAAGTVWCEKI